MVFPIAVRLPHHTFCPSSTPLALDCLIVGWNRKGKKGPLSLVCMRRRTFFCCWRMQQSTVSTQLWIQNRQWRLHRRQAAYAAFYRRTLLWKDGAVVRKDGAVVQNPVAKQRHKTIISHTTNKKSTQQQQHHAWIATIPNCSNGDPTIFRGT